MERTEGIARLRELIGQDLHPLALRYGVTVKHANGKVNKGWAGHVFERHLGLPLNSSHDPNFGSWELKGLPIKRKRDGSLVFKETMFICKIDPINVMQTPFEKSWLLKKLSRVVSPLREVGNHYSDPTIVRNVIEINLDGDCYHLVKQDYELIRSAIATKGFESLTGRMGTYIQPRTKGKANSTSRAFYARKEFLALFTTLV